MTDNWHTPYIDGTTSYVAVDMNVPLGELDARITTLATSIYDIGGSFEGVPTSLQTLLRFPLPRTVAFPINMVSSQMIASIAATAETIFSIQKNGVEFATATFAIAGTIATFAAVASAPFAAGDILTIVAPATADATLGNLGWSLVASRIVLS